MCRHHQVPGSGRQFERHLLVLGARSWQRWVCDDATTTGTREGEQREDVLVHVTLRQISLIALAGALA